MEKTLTIAEALQELKRIIKLIPQRQLDIRRYCSKRRGSKDEIDKQADYVKQQHQSALDLIKRYSDIKIAIQRSNLDTTITFKDKTYCIAEAILLKQSLNKLYTQIYNIFDDSNARRQINEYAQYFGIRAANDDVAEKLDLIPELYYDVKHIQQQKDDLLELMSYLDALIDKSNHSMTITI